MESVGIFFARKRKFVMSEYRSLTLNPMSVRQLVCPVKASGFHLTAQNIRGEEGDNH
jgi:hypothetical protein